jgi:hypothetical protein
MKLLKPLPSINKTTHSYEKWLASQLPDLNKDNLAVKHERMTENDFAFLRATYYRWLELWQVICPKLHDAPHTLCVGDLHAENFGIWRDADGRLVWGVNDFDEASPLPYTFDLVRLAASLRLALRQYNLAGLRFHEMCAALLRGYAQNIATNGRPFVLAMDHQWLREIALVSLKEPQRYWANLLDNPSAADEIPPEMRQVLTQALPPDVSEVRFVRRVAGLGSLGQPRWTALAQWRGDWIAREVKALPPTTVHWLVPDTNVPITQRAELVQSVARAPDPFHVIGERWVLHRLAPDCVKLSLDDIQSLSDWQAIIYAMGWETANIHRGQPENIAAIQADLEQRPHRWLDQAAKRMAKAIRSDWKMWRDRK